MAKGKCKKRAITFGKWVWKIIGPPTVVAITDTVKAIKTITDANPGWASNHKKREIVLNVAKVSWEKENGEAWDTAGDNLEGAVRVVLENALHQIKDGADVIEAAVADDEDDPITI
jgi:hypothetical protein